MTGKNGKSSRRAFFLKGGAVLGAGVAATVGASASSAAIDESLGELRRRLATLEDREAIRQLQGAFTTLVQQRAYDAAAELFDEHAHLDLSGASATGELAIRELFAHQEQRQRGAAIHSGYRQNSSLPAESVTLSEDRLQATATFHVEAELCTPLADDCTAAQMARLQGNFADRRWENGRFEVRYVKTRGDWKIASLIYRAPTRIR